MAVKLYNCSPYPDAVLLPLLTSAMRLAGATGDVIVKVTRGGERTTSHAQSATFVYEWFLRGRKGRKRDGELKRRMIQTSGGYVVMEPRYVRRYWTESQPSPTGGEIRLSRFATCGLATAQRFLETAIHEFAHIVQFQTGLFQSGKPAIFARRYGSGRRAAWAKRPEEIDAVNRTDDALAKLKRQKDRYARIQDEIIALALAVEQEEPAS